MLGDFINRGLVMILGYAYPAFECFKTVEKNKVEIEELRFWCQYWMIIAALSVCERFGDLFISWLPFYGEMKVGFIVFLWYPKTKGSTTVYEALLKPLVSKHETDIDRNIQELKLRAWDFAMHYCQNFANVGQSAFFNVVQYVLQQSYRIKGPTLEPQQAPAQQNHQPVAEFAPSTPVRRVRPAADSPRSVSRRWPPASMEQSQSFRATSFKAEAQAQKNNGARNELDEAQSEYVHVGEVPDSPGSSPNRDKSKFGLVGSLKRRSMPVN